MKNRSILRKFSTILVLSVSAIVFLPATAFAKGAVIGYSWGDINKPVSDAQLNRLNHVMACDLYPDANGYLHSNPYLNPKPTLYNCPLR